MINTKNAEYKLNYNMQSKKNTYSSVQRDGII